ncbi:hypothetical protein Droror1_Dr00022345 [Drosera rotundifolia]
MERQRCPSSVNLKKEATMSTFFLIALVLSILLFLLTYIYFFYAFSCYNHLIIASNPTRTMSKYAISATTHLRTTWHLLLRYTIFPSKDQNQGREGHGSELMVERFGGEIKCKGEAECAVCLCAVEQGEEIRVLRCDHLFHKVCLDGWTGRRATCPLCRGSIARQTAMVDEDGAEVLMFQFWSSDSGRDGNWWLR